MKRYCSAPILVIAVLCLSGLKAEAASISLSEYRRQLHDIVTRLDGLEGHPEGAGEALTTIPDQVIVNTGAGEVTVSYRDLKNDLAAFSKQDTKNRAYLLRQIRNYCKELEDGTQAQGQTEDLERTRSDLKNILAQREFHSVHGPDAMDVLLGKLNRWLARVLGKLFRSGVGRFDWFRILSYPLIGAAVVLLAVWIARRLKLPEEEPVREIIPFAPSARSWRSWLAEARTLAQQQEWRNAIHIAYWAGISFLEENGAWKPNRARTPREYLRMVGPRKPQYPALAALTRKFEVVWYGHRNAGESDFQDALGQLEKLGCR
jgi:hypothetical protein